MDSSPHLSVVIPAYCEADRLPVSLPAIRAYLEAQPHSWEILVVDDGSTDDTSAVAKRLLEGSDHQVLRNEPNAGKGASIRRGMLASRGAHVLFSDADLSTPIEELDKFWPLLAQGADVVIGSRALPDSDLLVRQVWYRELMGRTFNVMVQALLLRGIHDTQCGFKLFTRRAVDFIFPLQTMSGFAFDVEVLALAREGGFAIAEVPVRWLNSPASKVSAVKDSARMFCDVLRLRRRLRQLRRAGTFAAPAPLRGPLP